MSPVRPAIRIGLLGAGTVGAEVAARLIEHRAALEERIGAPIELVGVVVRDLAAPRTRQLPADLITTDAERVILGSNIVVELIGGVETARRHVLAALESGADVVTGNKALIATHGAELFAVAERVGAQLNYEAAVAGAIPIIRPLRDNLAGDNVSRVLGIVNGTTNFILDSMDERGDTFAAALERATELGYAEADPTSDVSGADAAQKAAILAGLAFHTNVPLDAVYREGIEQITAEQVAAARAAGYVVKLLAICERLTDSRGVEGVSARVHPALIPRSHPLAAVHGANNAVFVQAEAAGDLMFYGAGAGGKETASAVLGDIVSAARRHVIGGPGLVESFGADLPVLELGLVVTRYQITLAVRDQPGVLAGLATLFSAHGVSIETVEQSRTGTGGTASLIVGTHRAVESALAATVAALEQSSDVSAVRGVIRIEGV